MSVAFSPVQSIPSSIMKLKNPQALSFRRNVFTQGKNEIFSTFTCPMRVDFKFPGRIPREVIEPLRVIRNRPSSFAHSMCCIEKCWTAKRFFNRCCCCCFLSNLIFFCRKFYPAFSGHIFWSECLTCRYDFTGCILFCSLISFIRSFSSSEPD